MIDSHNTDIDRAFYNDRVKEIIAASIIAEPFTYIPIKAEHMELVGGNAVVFGKITEGYDVIAIDVETEITYEDVSLINPIVSLLVKYELLLTTMCYYNLIPGSSWEIDPHCIDKSIWDGTQSWRHLYGVAVVTLPLVIVEDSTYSISVVNSVEGLNYVVSYKAVAGDTYVQVKAALEALFPVGVVETGLWGSNKIFIYARNDSFEDKPYHAGDVNTIYKDFLINAYILTLGLTVTYPQLKCGAVQSFGFVYKDGAGRTCSVIKADILDIYIPFYSEDVEGGGNDLNSIINLIFKINHKPPEWAESYEIVYFGNISMDYFLQVRASSIVLIPNSNGNRFSVNIQDTLTHARGQNNRWKVADYVWNNGDRMRLVGTINQTTYYGEAIGGDYVYDYEIESTSATYYSEEAVGGDWLRIQAVERPTPFAGATNIIVEVYRPKKGFGKTLAVAYGTGMVFDIATDAQGNRYHKGDVDQSIINDTPAEVHNIIVDPYDPTGKKRITRAYDCWKFFRLNYEQTGTTQTGIIQPFWAESIFPSDWWGEQIISNKLTSQGFPFLEDLSQKQKVLDERIRHGGFIITGTRTNNIAHFTYDDFMDLPEKNGDITGLREIGYTLKVIQMYKETSIYINRIQTFNPDGTEQFTLTDKFLAEQRPMESDYGCQHPDSVMVNGRNLYYWDHSQGKFIRSAPNGQIVLDIKMKKWFKDLVKWIQANGGGKVLQTRTGANNEHDEVWLTFRMGDEVRGVIFSEKKGRYASRINQITESYVHLGNFFAHLYHQRVWIMNVDEGQDYLSWSGTPTYAEIEVVSNIEPVRNKVYNAIALFADHEMNSLPKYVYIPAEASGGSDIMESNVPIWDRREGVFFGEILKDENSKGNFISLNDRKMNGRAMRGRYCFVKLNTEEHTEKVRIDSIVIFSTPSERNI